jgi:hypothetical protein
MKKTLLTLLCIPTLAVADNLVELVWDASPDHSLVSNYVLYGSTNVTDLVTNLNGCMLQAPVGTNLTATVDVPAGEPWAFTIVAKSADTNWLDSPISNILELNRLSAAGNLRKK